MHETQDQELLERFAREVVVRRMEVPAIFVLELYKPLSRVLHSASVMSAPLFVPLFGTRLARNVQALLESPENVEQLIRSIESEVGQKKRDQVADAGN